MTKLLAFGDVHLGAGSDYGRAPGDRLRDQDEVLQRIATLAADRGVDGILCAGDVFDRFGTPEQLDVFARFVAACHSADIPILSVVGNGVHDGAMRDVSGLAIFAHLPGITISAMPDVYLFAGCCAVATLPWVSPARLIAARNGGDRAEINAEVASLLVDIAGRGKEDCERLLPGGPHILLGHWHADVALDANGGNIAQFASEPILPYADIDALGYDHVVLGHNHHSQALGSRGFHPGSPLCLNFGEEQLQPQGVVIVHTDEREEIDYYAAEFVLIESRPFVTLDVDLTEIGDADPHNAIVDAIEAADVNRAVTRVRYRATTGQARRIYTDVLRKILIEDGAAVVKIVPDIVRADRARVEGLDEAVDELAAVDEWLRVNETAAPLADRMREKAREYVEAGTS